MCVLPNLLPAERKQLENHAATIRELCRLTAGHAVEIGRLLTESKEILGHGRFGEWLEAEFDWSERAARRFMEVHDRFKSANLAEMKISLSALYTLSAPSVPEEAAAVAMERAEAGEEITPKVASQIVAERKTLKEAIAGLPPEKAAAILQAMDDQAEEKRRKQLGRTRAQDDFEGRLDRCYELTTRIYKLLGGIGPEAEEALEKLTAFRAALNAIEL